jgi:hypothetical protein
MSVIASPAFATADSAAATNDRPVGNRRNSDVCDRNTRRGGGSLGTTRSIPGVTHRENTDSRANGVPRPPSTGPGSTPRSVAS